MQNWINVNHTLKRKASDINYYLCVKIYSTERRDCQSKITEDHKINDYDYAMLSEINNFRRNRFAFVKAHGYTSCLAQMYGIELGIFLHQK